MMWYVPLYMRLPPEVVAQLLALFRKLRERAAAGATARAKFNPSPLDQSLQLMCRL